jgi:tetratricopeptide (TPR) repeat protein
MSKKAILVSEKHMHEQRISELSHYIEAVQRRGSEELLYTDDLPVMKETQKIHTERAIFLIKEGEYKRAAEALNIIMDTGYNDLGLLVRILSILEELERRRMQLIIEDPFADLKLSYLTEDYEKTIAQVDELNADPFLRPLLGGLNTALYQNIEIAGNIDEDLNLRNDVKSLIGMASRLEKIGEYRKAVNLYRKLLLFDLPPHDREYLASKLYSAMKLSIGSELKRRDNTRAIKLLEDARRLVWEGKKDEALKQYLLLIKECPNSDYIGQAVGEIVGLRG